ncbi:MAG: hypothetical protein H6Q04_3491, partial [Acidobacteria bacterium]|nr:hypothetical protein [Acidobacteriota bacterium]
MIERTVSVSCPYFNAHPASNVRILDSNRVEIPSQTQVLATWDKGGSSIKWILFDFQANVAAQSSSTYYVEYGPTVVRKSFSADLNVSQLSDRITVRTGPLSFSIRKDRFNFLDEASINGISIITPSHGQDFYVQDQDGMVYKASNPLSDYTVTVEDAGPLRAQIKCAGWFVSDTGEKRFKYEVRFQAYAGKPILRVYSTVIFTEDMFKYRLKDVALKTPLSLSGSLTYAIGGESKVAAGILNRDIHLLQDDYNHYSIKNIAGAVVQEGSKSAGWLDLSASDSSAGITAFIRDMWQAYPMELEANGNSLIAHLWPAHADFTSQVAAKKVLAAKKTIGHFWPFHGGGELNLQAISPDPNESGCSPDNPEACLYYDNLRNAAGISKTYELVYYFHNGGHSDANSPSVIEAYGNELMAINGSWVSQTEAFGKMHPYDPDNFSSAEDVLQKAFASIVKSQQSRADYGMVNYGDAHYGYSAAGSGHRYWLDWRVNWQNSLWILYARSGNPDYLNFAIASTRHVMDIDTAQVDLSFTDINGNKVTKDAGCMIRTHEIGASHWHSNSSGWPDTQMDGNIDPLLAYYYLTGYRRARDVAEMRAKQVLNSVSEYNAWPAARTAAGALGVPLEMYQLTWDEKYLTSANTTFAIILAKLPRPDGYWGRSAINWDVMTTTWIPAQFEKYCRISGNAAAKKEFLRVAKALGGLGLTEDTNGTRTYGYPFRLYSYAYELTG